MTEADAIAGILAVQEEFDARLLRSLEANLTGDAASGVRVIADQETDEQPPRVRST